MMALNFLAVVVFASIFVADLIKAEPDRCCFPRQYSGQSYLRYSAYYADTTKIAYDLDQGRYYSIGNMVDERKIFVDENDGKAYLQVYHLVYGTRSGHYCYQKEIPTNGDFLKENYFTTCIPSNLNYEKDEVEGGKTLERWANADGSEYVLVSRDQNGVCLRDTYHSGGYSRTFSQQSTTVANLELFEVDSSTCYDYNWQ